MIRAAFRADTLIQRLRTRAARLATIRLTARRRARPDWYSAAALWPDLMGDTRDGK